MLYRLLALKCLTLGTKISNGQRAQALSNALDAMHLDQVPALAFGNEGAQSAAAPPYGGGRTEGPLGQVHQLAACSAMATQGKWAQYEYGAVISEAVAAAAMAEADAVFTGALPPVPAAAPAARPAAPAARPVAGGKLPKQSSAKALLAWSQTDKVNAAGASISATKVLQNSDEWS